MISLQHKIPKLLTSDTLKDSAISFTGHMASALMNLVFFALVTRRLGPAQFGLFALSMTTTYLCKDFVDLALDSAILRFLPGEKYSRQLSHLKTIFLFRLAYLIPLFITGFIFRSPLTALVYRQPLSQLLVLSLFWTITQSLLSFITTALQARKNFSFAAFLISFVTLVRISLLGLIFWFDGVSVASLIAISFSADLIATALGSWKLKLSFLTVSTTRKEAKRILKFSLPMLATSVSGIMADKLNVYLTNYYTSMAEVGLLTAASRLFTPFQSLTGSLSRVFGSRFAAFTKSSQARVYLLKALSLSAILASGLVFSALLAKPLMLLFYGRQFLPAAEVFQILTLGFALFMFQVPLTSYILYFLGKSSYMASISIVQLITTVVFNLALIPAYHMRGAAIAFVLVMLISLLMTSLFVKLVTLTNRSKN